MENRKINLPTYADINQSLAQYDADKSFWRKYIISDNEEIKLLRHLARNDNHELSLSDLFNFIQAIIILDANAEVKGAEATLVNTLLSNKELADLADAVEKLKESNIFTEANFKAVLTAKTKSLCQGRIFNMTALALITLHCEGMLTTENRDAVNQCLGYPIYLVETLILLNQKEILTSKNRMALVNHSNLKNIYVALKKIDYLIITQEDFDAIIDHIKPEAFAVELIELAKNNILNHHTRHVLKKHPNPFLLSQALICLHDPNEKYIANNQTANLFTLENIEAVSAHAEPLDVVKGLVFVSQADLLTAKNRDIIKNHPNPKSMAITLIVIDKFYQDSSFLSKNMDMIIAHQEPYEFCRTLFCLHKTNQLTPEIRDAVKNHNSLKSLEEILRIMNEEGCMTYTFINRMIKADDSALESSKLMLEFPLLKQEVSHPYTIGALKGLFFHYELNLCSDIANAMTKDMSRSCGGNIAKTCKAAAIAANEEERIHYKKLNFK